MTRWELRIDKNKHVKGTVSVISSDPSYKDGKDELDIIV